MRYKRICMTVLACLFATFAAAMPIYASDDSIAVEATPYILYTETTSYGVASSALKVAAVGSSLFKTQSTYEGAGTFYFSNTAYMKIEQGVTYTITFDLDGVIQQYESDDPDFVNTPPPDNFTTITFLDHLATDWHEFGSSLNSEGVIHDDFVKHSRTWFDSPVSTKNDNVTYTYVFSTASGYIDNVEPGEYYVNFFNTDEDHTTVYSYKLKGISVEAVFDPTAEYYQNLLIGDLDEKGKELTEVGTKASEHENWALDKAAELHSEAAEQMSLNLDMAKSFISASTFAEGGSSIAASAAAFGTIYNQILAATPPEIQALVVIIPTLAFIGWVVGRVQ